MVRRRFAGDSEGTERMFATPEVRDGALASLGEAAPLANEEYANTSWWSDALLLQEVPTSSDTSGDSAPQQSYLHTLIRDQLDLRGMSIRELAKACGTTTTVVSRWVTSDPQRRVIPESRGCVQLARALDLPVVEVLVAAGRIPPPDGRPHHPYEAEIKRLTLALDLALRRMPLTHFRVVYRIVAGQVRSLTTTADDLTVDEMAGGTDSE